MNTVFVFAVVLCASMVSAYPADTKAELVNVLRNLLNEKRVVDKPEGPPAGNLKPVENPDEEEGSDEEKDGDRRNPLTMTIADIIGHACRRRQPAPAPVKTPTETNLDLLRRVLGQVQAPDANAPPATQGRGGQLKQAFDMLCKAMNDEGSPEEEEDEDK